jgi:Arc/MetJ family transcription regulator
MRTTLALDDDLLEKAQALTGLMEKTALVREALKALYFIDAPRRHDLTLMQRRHDNDRTR